MGWVVNATPLPLYTWEKDPVSIPQEAVWAPGPVWRGAENLAPHPHQDLIPGPSRSKTRTITTVLFQPLLA